jgi:hypothetical protein
MPALVGAAGNEKNFTWIAKPDPDKLARWITRGESACWRSQLGSNPDCGNIM